MPYLAADNRYQQMIYNRTGRSGLKLPAIALGWWYNFGGVDVLENSRAIARRAFDAGITHFDLANNYGPPPGSAEETFGLLLRQDFLPYRDELIISTKAGYDMWAGPYGEWGSRKYLLASLDASLRRMGLEYVDIFYHHRPDPDTPMEESMERPKIADRNPRKVQLEKGKSYAWCACGRSRNQPFCDGSHVGTSFTPLLFETECDCAAMLCQCKRTGKSPMCDGTHSSL